MRTESGRQNEHISCFRQDDSFARNSHFTGKQSMGVQLAVFPVDGDEIPGARQVEHQLQLFLAGVSGYVHRPLAFVIDSGAAAAEMIHQARDASFRCPG